MKHARCERILVEHESLHWLHANGAIFVVVKVDVFFRLKVDHWLLVWLHIVVLFRCPDGEALVFHSLYLWQVSELVSVHGQALQVAQADVFE
jgi:hypothetical protein